jgi:M6 family metalloprotease-like protein
MSAIFGETLTFDQENGPDIRLVVIGDEFYSRYENLDGFTVVYDIDLGLFCYAVLRNGAFVSSGVSASDDPPAGVRRHLQESEEVRHQRYIAKQEQMRPPPEARVFADTFRTLGPNEGLLNGRRVNLGAIRGLTILVEFQDVRSTVTQADVTAMLNGDDYTANGNYCSVRQYFRLMSNGRLDYNNEVVGPFVLSRNRHYYTNHLLVPEALNMAVASGVDLRRFDSRGEGIVDALNIMYAGQTQYLGDLWPHNASIGLRYSDMRTYFYQLTSMGRTAADLSIGTFCHESGHMLCRFPDLYDYGNRDGDGVESAGLGLYCLMSAGNHLNRGRTPSPICGYLRDLAEWCEDEIDLDQPSEYAARYGSYGTVLKYKTHRRNEYFIVENRSKLGLDQHLPASGLAVYHCDTRGSNEWQEGTSSRHYQCALLQADGRRDLEHNVNQGDGSDLFGAVEGTALSHATQPASRMWDGSDSGLILSRIGPPGEIIRFTMGEVVTSRTVDGEATPRLAIPDNDPRGVSSAITLSAPGTVREMRVGVDISHTYIGDLRVELVSPMGRQAVLHGRLGGSQDDLRMTYDTTPPSALTVMVGQPVRGDWLLRVTDLARRDVGTLNRWSLAVVTGT